MMKILNSLQIKETENFTIEKQQISSVELMERASNACIPKILSIENETSDFIVFCGKGNNGGDGLAISRLLIEKNRKVTVFIVNYSDNSSHEFNHQLNLLSENHKNCVSWINHNDDFLKINWQNNIVIDAIIGIGLNKEPLGILKSCIECINQNADYILAIDIPTGLSGDNPEINHPAIIANQTLTFHSPKFSFFFPEIMDYTGKITVLDIGLEVLKNNNENGDYFYTYYPEIQHLLHPRLHHSHKGNFGHALLICGQKGMMGAAQIAAKSCLRSGVGLVTVKVPGCGLDCIQQSVPEAMAIDDEENDFISSLPSIDKYHAIGMGCGIGTQKQTGNVLKLLIQNFSGKLLLDADALNLLSQNKTWISFLPQYTILTPHPGEFDRLTGKHSNSFERLKTAVSFAKKHQIILVLKGARTAIIMPDGKVFFNSTGNAGLAKGGSGDALSGIITGLLARGYAPNHAAIIGVFIHGLAADLCMNKNHVESLLISDVIDKLPKAFQKLYS